jgi:hypothetical protein
MYWRVFVFEMARNEPVIFYAIIQRTAQGDWFSLHRLLH